MAFYVAVGPRGLLFRLGMISIGVMGPLTYWWSSRRRGAFSTPSPQPAVLTTAQAPSVVPSAPDHRSLAHPLPAVT